MSIFRNKTARRTAFALAGLLLLLSVAIWLLQTDWAREAAFARLRDGLRKQNILVESGRLDYDLPGLRASLRNVTLRAAQAPALPPMATIENAQIALNWNTLSTFSLDLNSATIVGLKLHVVIAADGTSNLPQSPASTGTVNRPDWLIRQGLVRDASLLFEDRIHDVVASIAPFNLQVSGSTLTHHHALRLGTAKPARVVYQGRVLPVETLLFSGVLEKSTLRIEQAALASGTTRADVSGRVDFDGQIALKVASTLDASPLLRFIGRPERVSGQLRLNAEAIGAFAKPKVTATVEGRQLSVENFANIDLSAKANYDAAVGRVQLLESSIQSPEGVAKVTGDIAVSVAGESRVDAEIDRLNMEKLVRIAQLPITPASRISLNLSAKWPALAFEKAVTSGTLRLTPTQDDAGLNRLPIGAEIGLSGRMDQLKAEIRSIRAAGMEGTGTLFLAKQRDLSGTFAIRSNSLAAMLRQSNLVLGQNVMIDGLDGRVDLAGTLGGTIASPSLQASLSGEGLQAKPVQAKPVQAKPVQGATLKSSFSFVDKVASIDGLALNWNGQTLLAGGTIDLNSRAVDIRARTENLRIEKLLTGDVSGSLQADVHAAGTLDQLVAAIDVSGENIVAYSEPIGTLAAKAEWKQNVLELNSLRLPEKDFQATGTYQLASGAYTLDAQAPAMKLNAGTFALSAKGSGTIANPQLDAQASTTHPQYGLVGLSATLKDRFADLNATAAQYSATANGRVGIDAPYPATFALQSIEVPLESTVPKNLPLAGSIRVAAEGQGNLERWQEGSASFRAELLGVKWNQEAVTTQAPIEAEFANGTFRVKPLLMNAAGSNVSLEGSLPLDPKSTQGLLRMNAEVDLGGVPKLIPDWQEPATASGTLRLNAEVRGNLQRIEPTATLSLRDGIITPKGMNPVAGLELEAKLEDGTLLLERLSGTYAKSMLSASAEFPLGLLPKNLPIEFPRKAGVAKVVFDGKGLDIAALEGVPANTTGTVSVHVEGETASAELAAWKGSATVEEMKLRVGDTALEQAGKSIINLADGTARVENFAVKGPGTELALRGSVGLLGERPVTLRLAGDIETAALSAWITPARMRGPAKIQLSLFGPAAAIQAAGFVEIQDGQLLLPQPRINAESINARIDLAGDRLSIARFEGSLNGGTVMGKGGLRFVGGEAREVDFSLNANSVYLDYPYGLRTLSDTALTLKQNGGRLVLGGDVKIQEGSFRELISIEGNLLSLLNSQDDPLFAEERNKYLDLTNFNVNIKSESPLLVKNNLAKAGINMDLRLTGNYYRPALLGRITLEEGGELYFSERSYAVERGVITFSNDQKIEPQLDILASTRVASHDISLLISGGGTEKISTLLSSDPVLPEQDILAMLITGKSPEEFKNSDTATLASRQAVSYFAGSFGSRFTRQVERATGLSTVRVEPDLIANEGDPTARLTIGQDLSSKARLIYSMNLTNGGDQIYVAEYDITKRFTTRGVKQIDNTYRFDFRHDLRFGGEKPPAITAQNRDSRLIGIVNMPATGPIPEQKLRDQFKNKPGKRYDFFEVRKGLDRLEKLHRDANLLEARVRLKRDVKDALVDLTLDITAGPEVAFAYEGWEPGGQVRKQVRTIWSDGVFDQQRADDATRAMRTSLIEDGYLEAKIEAKVTTTERKLVVFDVQRGTKFGSAELQFPGASGIKEAELKKLFRRRDLRASLYLDTPKVRDILQSYYRERGYLDASVKLPQATFDSVASKATVLVAVTEGQRYQVSSVDFAGNTALKPEQLIEKSELKTNEPYELPRRQVSIDQLRELYLSAGYHDAQVETIVERGKGTVDVTYRINEGPKEVLEKVEISGNDATSEALVRSQIALKEGEALEPAKLAESRRNLYSTGAYALVDLERVPTGDLSRGGVKPVMLRAKVREVQPFALKYGGYLDTERGPGVVADFTNRNSLGSARAIGGRLRYDADFREGRVFFSQPLLRGFPVQSIASAFVNRTLLPTFISDRVGVSVQQEIRFRKRYLFNYGYRLERVHTYEKTPDEFLPFDVTLKVAPLTFTMNRETRDDVLDATKGSFVSNSLEWAPEQLGSDVRFIRYYGQFFKYVSLAKPVEIPMSGGVKKSRLVYAGAARVGLARGLGGQDLILSERFFAGGGTTLRGFKQNTLGPTDSLGDPVGGDAVVLLNNEIRFPMVSILDGVGFLDIGNTYRRVSDINFGDLRKAAGVGLRVRTPYFLIRLDYGFKLDRRPGESIGGFFFSIGQAF